jgi:hypothetical protein
MQGQLRGEGERSVGSTSWGDFDRKPRPSGIPIIITLVAAWQTPKKMRGGASLNAQLPATPGTQLSLLSTAASHSCLSKCVASVIRNKVQKGTQEGAQEGAQEVGVAKKGTQEVWVAKCNTGWIGSRQLRQRQAAETSCHALGISSTKKSNSERSRAWSPSFFFVRHKLASQVSQCATVCPTLRESSSTTNGLDFQLRSRLYGPAFFIYFYPSPVDGWYRYEIFRVTSSGRGKRAER